MIGGSLGLAVRQRLGLRVIGIDLEPVLGTGRATECADELVAGEDLAAVSAAVGSADIAVLAMPVSVILGRVGAVLERCDTVTDCGSTKRLIAAAADRSQRPGRFVPGHPMAGAPRGGLTHARADLFEGRPWILCAERRDRDAVARVDWLVRGIGAEPVSMSAEEHDLLVARVSHLPQLVASAVNVLGTIRTGRPVAGPAYEGITRTAGGDPSMWGDVFLTNADQVARALRELEGELEQVAQGLEREPADIGPALRLLARARSGDG